MIKQTNHMKSITTAIMLLIALSINAQDTATENNITVERDYYTADAKSYTENKDENSTEFTGNVNFYTNAIEIKGADKIVFNELTREILAYGNYKMKLLIPITMTRLKSKDENGRSRLRYRLGDDKAYME